ncbi:MAG: GNAT family N-acetyltransferase [Bdellovibrionota bacterium]
MKLPILKTDRLTLSPLSMSDFLLMRELDTDPEVVKYLAHGQVRAESETTKFLAKILNDYEKYGLGLYKATLTESGEFVGRAGLIPWNIENEFMWEVGCSLKPSFWKKGLATEATEFLIDWAFNNLSVNFIIGLIDPENQNSINVSKKIGMSFWKTVVVYDCTVDAYRVNKKGAN